MDARRAERCSELRPKSTETGVKALGVLQEVMGTGSATEKIKATGVALRFGLQLRSLDTQSELAHRVGDLERFVADINNAEDDALGQVSD